MVKLSITHSVLLGELFLKGAEFAVIYQGQTVLRASQSRYKSITQSTSSEVVVFEELNPIVLEANEGIECSKTDQHASIDDYVYPVYMSNDHLFVCAELQASFGKALSEKSKPVAQTETTEKIKTVAPANIPNPIPSRFKKRIELELGDFVRPAPVDVKKLLTPEQEPDPQDKGLDLILADRAIDWNEVNITKRTPDSGVDADQPVADAEENDEEEIKPFYIMTTEELAQKLVDPKVIRETEHQYVFHQTNTYSFCDDFTPTAPFWSDYVESDYDPDFMPDVGHIVLCALTGVEAEFVGAVGETTEEETAYINRLIERLTNLIRVPNRILKINNNLNTTPIESFCAAIRTLKRVSNGIYTHNPSDIEDFLFDTVYATTDFMADVLNMWRSYHKLPVSPIWDKRGKQTTAMALLEIVTIRSRKTFNRETAVHVLASLNAYYANDAHFNQSQCYNMIAYVEPLFVNVFDNIGVIDLMLVDGYTIDAKAAHLRRVIFAYESFAFIADLEGPMQVLKDIWAARKPATKDEHPTADPFVYTANQILGYFLDVDKTFAEQDTGGNYRISSEYLGHLIVVCTALFTDAIDVSAINDQSDDLSRLAALANAVANAN